MADFFMKLNDNGVALVLSLLTISFLVAMTVGLSVDVDSQIDDAASIKRNLVLDSGLTAGLNVALAVIQGDQLENGYDSSHDTWAQISPEEVAQFYEETELEIEVIDLSGLLSVNSLLQLPLDKPEESQEQDEQQVVPAEDLYQVWLRLLLSGHFAVDGEQEAREILDCILDWLDEDDDERPNGAENAYYQSLPSPYESRNGFLAEVEELLAVKGVSSELLYGDEEHKSLASFITAVKSDGKININTAPVEVLEALSPQLSLGMAEEMIAYRQEEFNIEQLESVTWYKDVVSGDVLINEAIISVKSMGFKIKVTASLEEGQKKGEGIFYRGMKNENKLLRWRIQ